MMSRFCRYVDKCFHLQELVATLRDARPQPQRSSAAVFASVFALFASNRTSLNSLEKDLVHLPSRLRGVVGPRPPSIDTLGRVYALLDSASLRQVLVHVHHRLKRNKALADGDALKIVAVDGHEFFASRKRCCPQCQQRTIKVQDEEVTEYYHQGVVCHLIDHQLAVPLDVELLRPGEGEETAAKRLLQRVFANYGRFFDVVCGDALYLDAPFINFCLDHHKHALVVVKGDHRLLLQDAAGVFAQQPAQQWQDRQRTVQSWDEEGFTTCAGVPKPLRVVHTVETVRRRERVARQWQEKEETSSWYWATTLSQRQLSTQRLWRAGHHRWDVENACFNTLATHWGLDHCFQHDPTAIVNFVLTLFLVYTLLQCFWQRNLKAPVRAVIGTLIGLAEELRRSLGSPGPGPCDGRLTRAP
ncbi:MAG TPA: transposase [Gemmataceae bacterium]|nr:transposase [Gemmataceae bacterium]